VRDLIDRMAGRADLVDDFSDLHEKHFTLGSESGAASRPVEQLNAESALQVLDLHAQGRLRDV
jgi:hypothetical protein